MTENNNIENLFKEAFSNYEAPVDASLWQGIENVVSQPPVAVPVVANTVVKSFSAFKLFVAAAALSVVGVTSYFVFDKEEVKPSSKIETNTTLFNNAGSVSETKTQPTPEKIVVNETKPVSATKKQSSPVVFHPANSINNETAIAEKPTNKVAPPTTSEEDQKSPKPSETKANASSGVITNLPETKNEQAHDKMEGPDSGTSGSPANPAKENVKSQVDALPFPGMIIKEVFTPDGDGKNDVFEVDDSQMDSIKIKIISSSGKTVYLRGTIGGHWDGTLLNGDEAPEGLYVVFINGKGLDGKQYSSMTRLWLKRN